MTMSASPLRAASRWLDASRSTSSTRTPTPASCAWIPCATRDSSTFVPVRHSRTSIPPEYPASARSVRAAAGSYPRSEEHTSELQSQSNLVCRLLLEKKKQTASGGELHDVLDLAT